MLCKKILFQYNEKYHRDLKVKQQTITMNLFAYGLIWILSLASLAQAESPKLVTTIGGGAIFSSNINNKQYFPIQNIQQDEYYIYQTQNSHALGSFDLFLGLEHALASVSPKLSNLLLQYGFNYHQPSTFNLNGIFEQGLDEISADSYNFNYRTIPHVFLAESKLFYQFKPNIKPLVFAGIGVSVNDASDFTTTAPPFITFTRHYKNHSQGSFSYTVGAGIDMDITSTWRIGAAWRFNNFGTIKMGDASINNTSVTRTLQLGCFNANEVLFSLSKIWLL